jgi:hypothetical protein
MAGFLYISSMFTLNSKGSTFRFVHV